MSMIGRTIGVMLVGLTLWACAQHEAPVSPARPPSPEPVMARKAPVGPIDPGSVERVAPEAARSRVQTGQALLVCAYGDERCAQIQLEGAITFSALEARLPQLPKAQEIIVYCA